MKSLVFTACRKFVLLKSRVLSAGVTDMKYILCFCVCMRISVYGLTYGHDACMCVSMFVCISIYGDMRLCVRVYVRMRVLRVCVLVLIWSHLFSRFIILSNFQSLSQHACF